MTGSRATAEILSERLRVVLALTEANAAHRLAQSQVSGAQLEVMTLEKRDAETPSPSSEVEAELEAAYARDETARARMSETEARIVALDARLDALDRELALADS